MIRLWVQLITDNKLKKNIIYESDKNYSRETFFTHLAEICYTLNIPTPCILKSHFESYENFNNMRFVKRDFVENFEYDKLVIENALV